MEARKFKQFVEQAARLSRRQRADLVDRLNRSLLQEKTAALCTFNAVTATPLAPAAPEQMAALPRLHAAVRHRAARGRAGRHPQNTSFRWRHRLLANTKSDRSWPLGGITEADATCLLESLNGSRQLDRPARRIGPARALPEQVCILVSLDRTGKTFDFVTGPAPLTRAQLRRCLASVVAPDIVLVTDGHPA